MLDFFHLQTSQNAVNYQEFYGGGTTKDWIKPRGAAMAAFLLIGAGAAGRNYTAGGNAQGGGSGAVTRWIGPAIFIPDILRISIGAGGASNWANGGATSLIYQQKDGTGYTLLTANGGSTLNGGAASANNAFGASGIFLSIAGQNSANLASVNGTANFTQAGASGTAATGGNGYSSTPLYGYPVGAAGITANPTGGNGGNGYFITEPVLLGCGGGGGAGGSVTGGNGGNGGIGCGGGGGGIGGTNFGNGGRGGDGAAFVWAW